MLTSEVLDKAADIIERGGLCKSKLQAGDARCARGAIMDAMGMTISGFFISEPKFRAVDYTLARAIYGNEHVSDAVAHWNNAPERTADEVIAMLRAVAATERARERTEIPPRMLPVVIRETVCA